MATTTVDPWHALADPTRRKVFSRVAHGRSSVTDIARDLPVSRPAVSQHLRVLLAADLVDVHQQGRQRLYGPRLSGLNALRRELESYWNQTLSTLKDVAEQSYLPDHHGTEGSI